MMEIIMRRKIKDFPYVQQGAALRAAREALGYTQKQVMEKLTEDPAAPAGRYQNWERGANRPLVDDIMLLSRVLNINARALYFPSIDTVPKFLRSNMLPVDELKPLLARMEREVEFIKQLIAGRNNEVPQVPSARRRPRLSQPNPGPRASIKQQHNG